MSEKNTQAEAPSEREALQRLESAVDWYLGRSSFTQTRQLKGMGHSEAIRKELYAAHDAARAALATQQAGQGEAVVPKAVLQAIKAAGFTLVKTVHAYHLMRLGEVTAQATTPPAPQQPEALAQQEREDAVLAYLDALGDDAIAHIWPDDLVKCQTSECVVEVASVRMGSPDGKTLPLFSRDQVREALRAARSSEGGQP